MSLVVPQPPEASMAALRTTLTQLAARGQFGARSLRPAEPEQLSITVPHQVFTLGAADLVATSSLDAARPTGWRYLVEVDERIVAAAETQPGDGNEYMFSHLNHGPFVTGTADALTAAEGLGDERDLELRLLHIPALYMLALWLRPADNPSMEASILVPISPTPPDIEPNREYAATELLPLLAERARSIPDLAAGDQRGGA